MHHHVVYACGWWAGVRAWSAHLAAAQVYVYYTGCIANHTLGGMLEKECDMHRYYILRTRDWK